MLLADFEEPTAILRFQRLPATDDLYEHVRARSIRAQENSRLALKHVVIYSNDEIRAVYRITGWQPDPTSKRWHFVGESDEALNHLVGESIEDWGRGNRKFVSNGMPGKDTYYRLKAARGAS
ncbi:hypothetical protein [Piscicoccus intestinalis]|uniref:hypothetical protein n=1 Tax=Piscicoccus intestinalis TaxID=746033 RepID=UPI000837EB77|nr:hypothetical protein [Piscicoccus intestinalis]